MATKRTQYIVLQPISPESGPLILPATPERDTPHIMPPPVLVDETIIGPEAAPILIELGIITPFVPALDIPRPTPDSTLSHE